MATKEIVENTIQNAWAYSAEQRHDQDYLKFLSTMRAHLATKGIIMPDRVDFVDGPSGLGAYESQKPKAINIQRYAVYRGLDLANRALGNETKASCDPANLELIDQVCGSALYALPDRAVIVRNPIAFHAERSGQTARLHCESGPAIEWADGTKRYYIRGIRVPEWVVEQKTSTAEQILDIRDVDVRAIAVQKFGVGLLLDGAELLDGSRDGYALYDLACHFDYRPAKYLWMRSISVPGLEHTEGVDNSCNAIQDAIDWRADVKGWNPCQIDEKVIDGGNPDQWQQGDVCFMRAKSRNEAMPKLDRTFVLSENSQKRHMLSGDYELFGDDQRQQLVVGDEECVLGHIEHGRIVFAPGVDDVWAIREIDHMTGIVSAVRD